jgi:hypothetical protein
MGVTGCGLTCLAMVAAGLTGDGAVTPDAVAHTASGTATMFGQRHLWELLTAGAASFGLEATEVPLWEDSMIGELNAGKPMIASSGRAISRMRAFLSSSGASRTGCFW